MSTENKTLSIIGSKARRRIIWRMALLMAMFDAFGLWAAWFVWSIGGGIAYAIMPISIFAFGIIYGLGEAQQFFQQMTISENGLNITCTQTRLPTGRLSFFVPWEKIIRVRIWRLEGGEIDSMVLTWLDPLLGSNPVNHASPIVRMLARTRLVRHYETFDFRLDGDIPQFDIVLKAIERRFEGRIEYITRK